MPFRGDIDPCGVGPADTDTGISDPVSRIRINDHAMASDQAGMEYPGRDLLLRSLFGNIGLAAKAHSPPRERPYFHGDSV
jgi:hypothetical protein